MKEKDISPSLSLVKNHQTEELKLKKRNNEKIHYKDF